MRAFMAGILGMGLIRFLLTVRGVPDGTVKYFSMTAIIAIAAVYFALKTKTHRERLLSAFLLILPYMFVEVAALGYTWATGQRTIFHSEDYSFGFSIVQHTLGHLVGGLTWEPLFLFLVIEGIWGLYSLARKLVSS